MTPSVRYAAPLLRGAVVPPTAGGTTLRAGVSFHAGPGMAAVRRADPATLHTLDGEAMGTTWRVRLANPRFLPLDEARTGIDAALALVVRQMSHWEADSDLSRFNRAPAGTWQALPPEFFAVLRCAFDWAQASGGAWDPTVAPLVALWGFGAHAAPWPGEAPPLPEAAALAAAQARVGHARVALDAATGRALQPGGAQLDLSGIAKGYSVDRVAAHLQALGYTDFLVEVGGELLARGARPDGQPWRVAIAGLPGDAQAPRTVALRQQAIATSGDHWHAYEQGGRRYSHTIDPRTGAPVDHSLSSVTVLHADCMQADALATVLTVLGPQAGRAFAEARGMAALLCERTPTGPVVAMTSAFAALA